MADAPKEWEGQIVEGIFPLRKYLGGSDHSAVFLTEYAEGEAQKAAIKFVPAERATADLVLTNWRFAAQLTHPNLLRLYRAGRCRIDGNDLLYLVMEHVDEDLADILPERALTLEETRDMLNPVLDALEYLHGKGLVHGDLKPANILAAGDQLKLSSDMISRAGENQAAPKKTNVYDPPEATSGMKTSAGDVWALGTTLVEVLTQKVPEWQPGPHREPVVPETVAAPFAEIARQCLRVEPNRRISVADVAERLNVRTVAASAAAAGSAAAGPVAASPAVATATAMAASAAAPATASPVMAEPKIAAARAGVPREPVPTKPALRSQAVSARPVRPQTYGAPTARPKYLFPLIAGALVFAAALTVPRLFRQRAESPASGASVSGQPAGASAPAKPVLSTTAGNKSERKAAKGKKAESAAPSKQQTVQTIGPGAGSGSLKPASENSGGAAASVAASSSEAGEKSTAARVASSKGEVLDQVLPDVSEKARATIRGSVRVGVKVHVDAAGAVSSAELDSAGPSAFFADLATKAARKWVFSPPEQAGKSVGSEWVLRFVFTQTDTKVTPTQTTP